MSKCIPVDRQTSYPFPPSVDDWLPENHLVRLFMQQAMTFYFGQPVPAHRLKP